MILSIILGILGVIVLACMLAWRRITPINEIHVVNSRKASTAFGYKDSTGKLVNGNTYFEVPSYIPYFGKSVSKVSLDIFSVNLNSYESFDIKKIPFTVSVVSFFRITDPLIAAGRVENMFTLKLHLESVLKSTVRKILSGKGIEEIMASRKALSDEFLKETTDLVKEWGVTPSAIEFTNIEDSEGTSVVTDIQNKERTTIAKESRIQVAANEQAATIAETIAHESMELRDVEKQQKVELASQAALQAVQESKKTTKEKEMAVKSVEINRAQEIEKQRAITEVQMQAEVSKVTAEGLANAQMAEAKGYREAQILKGQGLAENIKAEGNARAEVVTTTGKAEAGAKEAMALALAKMDESAINVTLIEAMVDMSNTKARELANAYSKADVKIISANGTSPSLLGVPLNAESGATINQFLDELPSSLKEKGKKLLETLSSKVSGGGTPA